MSVQGNFRTHASAAICPVFALLCIRFSRVLRKVSRPAVYLANRVSPYFKTDSCIFGTEFQGLIAYNSQRGSRESIH